MDVNAMCEAFLNLWSFIINILDTLKGIKQELKNLREEVMSLKKENTELRNNVLVLESRTWAQKKLIQDFGNTTNEELRSLKSQTLSAHYRLDKRKRQH